jgi:hypothetical protein
MSPPLQPDTDDPLLVQGDTSLEQQLRDMAAALLAQLGRPDDRQHRATFRVLKRALNQLIDQILIRDGGERRVRALERIGVSGFEVGRAIPLDPPPPPEE